MDKNAGNKWPWIISASIVAIIIACVVTIKFALKDPDEPSDYGMQNYHEYDRNANQIIEAKIDFDRHYTLAYRGEPLRQSGSVIRYAITDKNGNAVNNAKINILITRPNTSALDIALENPTVEEGVYTFSAVNLPKAGRWDILAKVNIDGKQRYFNIKADTRNTFTAEF